MTRTNAPNLRAVPPTRPNGPSRVPPHDLDAEAALIGAMLLSRDAIDSAGLLLTAGDFYRPAHAHIFDVIVALAGKAAAVDPVTVADELRRRGLLEDCGGPGELVALQASAPAIFRRLPLRDDRRRPFSRRRLIAADESWPRPRAPTLTSRRRSTRPSRWSSTSLPRKDRRDSSASPSLTYSAARSSCSGPLADRAPAVSARVSAGSTSTAGCPPMRAGPLVPVVGEWPPFIRQERLCPQHGRPHRLPARSRPPYCSSAWRWLSQRS